MFTPGQPLCTVGKPPPTSRSYGENSLEPPQPPTPNPFTGGERRDEHAGLGRGARHGHRGTRRPDRPQRQGPHRRPGTPRGPRCRRPERRRDRPRRRP
ncbi:hypothetical protein GPN2_21795 [Streptomyces murinus]